MDPVVAQEAGGAPQLAQGLDGPGPFHAADVLGVPAEPIEERRDLSLGGGVGSRDEHGGAPAGELGVDHERVAHGAEGLHEARRRNGALQALHEGVVRAGEEREDPVHRWAGDGIGGVDDHLAFEQAGHPPHGLLGHPAADRQDQHLPVLGHRREGALGDSLLLRPGRELLPVAAADPHVVPVLLQSPGERLPDVPRADHPVSGHDSSCGRDITRRQRSSPGSSRISPARSG